MSKVEKLLSAVAYLEGEFEEAQRRLRSRQDELSQAQTDYIGVREKLMKAKEALASESNSTPVVEVGFRERDIARMLGVELTVGEDLPDQVWAQVCARRSS